MTTSARFESTPKIYFENKTIIITDPCYILSENNKHHNTRTQNDWEKCEYGVNMEALGFTNYLTHDTIFGDWTNYIYHYDSQYDEIYKLIGEFGADSGLVSIFDLDEVIKYNPQYNIDWESEHGLAVKIENFTGYVWIEADVRSQYATVRGNGNIDFISDPRTIEEMNNEYEDEEYEDEYNEEYEDEELDIDEDSDCENV